MHFYTCSCQHFQKLKLCNARKQLGVEQFVWIFSPKPLLIEERKVVIITRAIICYNFSDLINYNIHREVRNPLFIKYPK